MSTLKSDYNPDNPADVREFSKAIADMHKSGPAGVNQAGRAITEFSKTEKGRKLLQKAKVRARIEAHSFGMDLSSVKVHTGSSSSSLGAAAYSTGAEVHVSEAKASTDLLGHELAHVVQQSAAKGKK